MPEKFKSKGGLLVYKATAFDTYKLGGRGICDQSNKIAGRGYLVAVLNHYLCPECYESFDKRATAYPEDEPIEKRRETYWDLVLV